MELLLTVSFVALFGTLIQKLKQCTDVAVGISQLHSTQTLNTTNLRNKQEKRRRIYK